MDTKPEFDPNQPSQNVDQSTQGISKPEFDPNQPSEDADTLGQQAIAGAEAIGRGVAGPLATGAERLLGVNPENIRAREEAHPITSTLGETAGFVVSAMAGVGLAKPVLAVGEAVGKLLPKVVPKLAAKGIATGAEMAALQSSDELSKMITNDPNQTIGTAISNIGLSAAIGTGGRMALGAVSPLWHGTASKIGLDKIIDDFKGQYEFKTNNPNPATTAVDELSNRIQSMEELRNQGVNLKGPAIAETLPEKTPINLEKIDNQIQDLSDKVASRLESASESVKTKSAVPYLAEDFNKFQSVVTDPASSMADKFNSIDQLKKDFASYAQFKGTEEATAKGALGRELSGVIRPMLEDSKVWGEAGNVQRKMNSAITDSIKAQKDMVSKFTSKQLGEAIVDPSKVQTYINQAMKSKAGLKQNVVANYLENTQKLADTVKEIHHSAGLVAPEAASVNPTPALNNTLQKITPGMQLANWAHDKGLAVMGGNAAATAVGTGLGTLAGHPYIGAAIGEKVLGPTFTAVLKPFAEKATNSAAAKSSINLVGQVIKGQKLQSDAIKSVLKGSSMVLPNHLIPKESDRDKLKKTFETMSQNPKAAMDMNTEFSHYLPDHGVAASSMLATAQSYMNSLKPKQIMTGPLEDPPPVSKSAEAQYNRQLDIVQQPLMVLQHAKDGTLIPQDVATLNTVYPGVAKALVQNITNSLIEAKSEGQTIPYSRRMSLSLLVGSPLDSTLTQPFMMASLMANMPKQPPQPTGKTKKQSGPSISQQQKTNSMYATETQAREGDKKT